LTFLSFTVDPFPRYHNLEVVVGPGRRVLHTSRSSLFPGIFPSDLFAFFPVRVHGRGCGVWPGKFYSEFYWGRIPPCRVASGVHSGSEFPSQTFFHLFFRLTKLFHRIVISGRVVWIYSAHWRLVGPTSNSGSPPMFPLLFPTDFRSFFVDGVKAFVFHEWGALSRANSLRLFGNDRFSVQGSPPAWLPYLIFSYLFARTVRERWITSSQ